MAAWHGDYRRESAAVKRAWGELLQALQPVRGSVPTVPRPIQIGAQCVALRSSVAAMEEGTVRAVPDPVVHLHLRRSIAALGAAAAVCDGDRSFLLNHRLETAARSFLELAGVLRRYRLSP